MELATQQKQAFDEIMQWFKGSKQVYTLAGYAGTGKTTLAKYIAAQINKRVVFCAYTGKAAKVLREKGCPNAGTIHSFLYSYLYRDENDNPIFGYDPNSILDAAGLIIVDEYSMLSQTIYDDLMQTGCKVLFLGDPFQLPPIAKDKIDVKPNFFLDEVHRQALESPVLKAATDVRMGNALRHTNSGDFIYQPKSLISLDTYLNASQVIVGKNDTRRAFNDNFRKKLGFDKEKTFQHGEKIICLKNNKQNGLLNGMIGVCKNPSENEQFFYFNFECDGAVFPDLKVWKGDILGWDQKTYNYRSGLDRFDYGYAITCHKSQGSEFEDVVIYNEPFGDDIERRRWQYTALTRAKTRAILVDTHG